MPLTAPPAPGRTPSTPLAPLSPSAPARPAAPPASRRAVRAARAAALCVLPSSLWRVALAVGVPVGYDADVLRDRLQVPGWGTPTLLGLSLLAEVVALLTVGLTRLWGERVPRWVPVFGGRAVRPAVVAAVAGTGAALLTLVFTVLPAAQLLMGMAGEADPRGPWLLLMRLCYAPLLAWGPLTATVVVAYHRRHRTRVGPRVRAAAGTAEARPWRTLPCFVSWRNKAEPLARGRAR
ncbi:hypothetical protein J7W19_09610 [Streptomyces mobaraensis NBRC 13819 = DSM 40847]|uniref:Uncharacterized protein n=1 Tax=Streptomyces mobaraensis (strain ATCC 29032 / DSM 40847 / JCM 4168 / NBRC 13819 / NCIMB 11159 / IPCR 16-22) TaxID=1223523 RepID=M3C0S2_STRM1|nr:hypothetical protein [Streptomyces mobaraensis]EME97551.1 hypothetical protein H340_26012 [Streptomyces mobaraensis NBRC 13819 = DSM 40847]QTT73644.1 hypothetical protein J7W19_09610 [Streptomyces mobaraensis NBRC 13819 = DSM 40847]